jgi:hypothetical protein
MKLGAYKGHRALDNEKPEAALQRDLIMDKERSLLAISILEYHEPHQA